MDLRSGTGNPTLSGKIGRKGWGTLVSSFTGDLQKWYPLVVCFRQEEKAGRKAGPPADGALTYGHENIFEGFYTTHVWRGIFASFDVHRITNPGYNRDRGPVVAPALRLHVDF